MRILLTVIFMISVLTVFAGTASFVRSQKATVAADKGGDRRAPFALIVPGNQPELVTEAQVTVATSDIARLRFIIRKPFDERINIGKVNIFINGVAAGTVGQYMRGPEGYLIDCDLKSKPHLRLRDGKNVIEIDAKGRDEVSYYASYVLASPSTKSAQATVRPGKVPLSFSGRKFAVLLGISDYRFNERGLTDLKYADADARAVRDLLIGRGSKGFSSADTLFLDNEKATVDGLRGSLSFFLSKAQRDDLVVLFIAGHGAPDPDEPQKLYLLLHDTKVADMKRTAMPMSELGQTLGGLKTERVVAFIDTCHSAGVSGSELVKTRGLGLENNLVNHYTSLLFGGIGRVILTSSDVDELSQESPKWGGHGVFTYWLLEGLKGAADQNRDRLVTTGELVGFVHAQVARETTGQQNPRAILNTNANLVISERALK